MVMKIKNIADIYPPGKGVKTVFITGVTGQDGSHMVDYLLKNTNAFILGGARRLSVENHDNIKHLEGVDRFKLVNFDLTDSHSIYKLMEVAQPDYFINFAAQSFVASSWDFARQTWATNSTAVLDCLEAIRRIKPACRFYNAGSSEEFGNVAYEPQDENHQPRPRSPYGASKSGARTIVKVYRESYGLYAVQGWLFNHEGPRRGEEFVTRKITKGVARIKRALEKGEPFAPIELGNLDAKRDWSDAEDMVDAVWRMVNQDQFSNDTSVKDINYLIDTKALSKYIKDYVVSSDVSYSIRQFIESAFNAAGIDWTNEKATDPLKERYVRSGELEEVLVTINPKFYRPAEVEHLRGNSTAIRKDLGWNPKSTFDDLVVKMVKSDLSRSAV
jgi:GDPmannose 4,6-dehydratase